MKCPRCQFDNPEGIKFCGECGAKIERICPKCNFSNPPEFKFCGECGHDLKEPKEAPPIYYAEPQSYTPKFLVGNIKDSKTLAWIFTTTNSLRILAHSSQIPR